jgi:hypothetical protein
MPEDFLVEEEAASSTPWATNRPVPGAAAVHSARQHTPAQTSRASRAAPRALSAARELLRHPPSYTASPGAMRQWRDDVDRLLSMAHSGSARPRPRSSQHQHEVSASVRSPSVRAALTEDLRVELNRRRAREVAPVSLERSNDLRAELNRRCAGEDARVSLERARERRLNFEGRNLDYDFAAVSMVQIGSTSSRPCYGGTGPHPAEPPGRLHSSWSTGLKPAFPRKSLWAPHRSSCLMSLCRNSYIVRMWTSSTSADGKRRSEMHGTTRCSGATTNGSCIVGSSRSGT